jgi:phosphoribosylanthranilate isomerase
MTPEDAALAAQAGADFIGMIMWQKAKRAVKPERARKIVEAAEQYGAQPVGVFVDEDAATISSVCCEAGLKIVQLHGDGARKAISDLPPALQTIYVMQSDPEGRLQTPLPGTLADGTAFQLSR